MMRRRINSKSHYNFQPTQSFFSSWYSRFFYGFSLFILVDKGHRCFTIVGNQENRSISIIVLTSSHPPASPSPDQIVYLHPFLPVLKVELKFKIVVSLSRTPKDWNYIFLQAPSKTEFQMYRKMSLYNCGTIKAHLTNLSERKVVFFVATQKRGNILIPFSSQHMRLLYHLPIGVLLSLLHS